MTSLQWSPGVTCRSFQTGTGKLKEFDARGRIAFSMAIFTLEEAARFSGRSPREMRLMLERGELPGRQRGGRWTVTSKDLEETLARASTEAGAHPPVGADPGPGFDEPEPADEARVRDRIARLIERIRRLERELDDVRGVLLKTESRVVELELELATRPQRPAPVTPARPQPAPEPAADQGMRKALTPLFRPDASPRSRDKTPRRDAGS